MRNYDFLPPTLKNLVLKGGVYELRLRADKQAAANINGDFNFISAEGLPYVTSMQDLQSIAVACAENSLYAQNDNLSRGYIACKNGVRVGVAGECVCENGKVITVKNFTGLCIRFAREVKGCADEAYKLTQSNGGSSVLIISPPGVGKTTLLRDLARQISQKKHKNVLIIDDKDEIACNGFDVGETSDVIRLCDKRFGFYCAVKTLSPDYVIADELISESDADGAFFAACSGVTVICSVHGKNYNDIKAKPYMRRIIDCGCFNYYLTLKKSGGGFKISEFIKQGE